MLASGGKILALGKVYHDETNLPIGPSLKGSGRPDDPLYVNDDWVIDQVNKKVEGATKEWVSANYQPLGNYVSATDFDDYKTEVQQKFKDTSAWAEHTFQPSGDYASASDIKDWALKTEVQEQFEETSAWAKKTFQPSGDYALKSDLEDWALKTEVAEEFEHTSAWANSAFQPKGNYQEAGDYVSAADFQKYQNEVSSAFSSTSAWANETFVTNNTFNEFKTEITNEVEQKFYTSAFSASFSSAFNQEFNTCIQSATSGWDHTDYSAGPGIKIEDHIVSLEPSAVPFDNYYAKSATSGANQLSDEFSKYKTWAETSAWAEQTFVPTSATEGWDVSPYKGDDGVYVDSETHTIGLSADFSNFVTEQELETALTSAVPSVISTDDTIQIQKHTSAGHPEYDLHVDLTPRITISGERGISAQDLGDGNWLIGASADNLAYLNTSFEKKESVDPAVPSGSIIQFTGGERKDITVTDGIITIPDSVDKFTLCMNATIDGNIPESDPHNYMLNQFTLSAVNGVALIRTHDYYPSEVGAADSNIAATIKHSKGRQYCIVYEGSDVLANANMNVQLTILEEVMSISDGSGEGIEYTGTLPISVNNQQRKINLEYDADFFTLNEDNELTLAQQSSSGSQPVDPALFNKLLNSVNQRIVETIPIGMVSSTKDQSIDNSKSYLFRPMIEFDMLSTTTARILTSNCTAGTSSVMVAVYEVDENTARLTPMWWSVNTVLQKQSGQHVLHCHPACTETRTLLPEKLYYVEVIVHGQTTHFLGIENTFRTDIGDFDITYGRQNVTSAYSNWNPSHFNGQPAGVLGDTALGDFKPYVGFRNDPV